jgi:site-specific DNA-methyltransferase (adenine-specific)/modification methylase
MPPRRIERLSDGVTLHLGDCREILPTLGRVDAVVTDPPYGISIAKNGTVGGSGRNAKWPAAKSVEYGSNDWDERMADEAVALAIANARGAIVFGGNYYDLPPASC